MLCQGVGRRVFFNDTATTEIYTLSLHDALPISRITHSRSFPDHHTYTRSDLQGLGQRPMLVTAKDAVKLADSDLPIHVLDVEFSLLEGESLVQALLDALPVPARLAERDALHAGLHG